MRRHDYLNTFVLSVRKHKNKEDHNTKSGNNVLGEIFLALKKI